MESWEDRLEEIRNQLQPNYKASGLISTPTRKTRINLNLSEEEASLFKPLVKDIPVFCDLPTSFRADILKLIWNFLTLEPGEQLITADIPKPDIYILYKGKLKFSKYSIHEIDKELEEIRVSDLFSNRENFKDITPIHTFGSIDLLSNRPEDRWAPKYVYALEESQLITLRYTDIKSKMKKLLKQSEFNEDSEFLRQNIPGLDNIIASNRNKIIQAFKRKWISSSKIMYHKRRDIPNEKSKIRIIKQGECKIVSTRVPMKLNAMSNTRKRKHQLNHNIVNNKGYFSNTTNSLQISIISNNHWIGDEVLIMRNEPYPYSVITNEKVIVYEISVEDVLSKIPKDLLHNLERNWRKKINFLHDRIMSICKSVGEVAKWDGFYKEQAERTTEISKKYSQASKSAISTLTNIPIVSDITSGAISRFQTKLATKSENFSSILKSKSQPTFHEIGLTNDESPNNDETQQ